MPSVTGMTCDTKLASGQYGLDDVLDTTCNVTLNGIGFADGNGVLIWNTGAGKSVFPNWTGSLSSGDSPQTVTVTCVNPSSGVRVGGGLGSDSSEVSVTVGDSNTYTQMNVAEGPPPSR